MYSRYCITNRDRPRLLRRFSNLFNVYWRFRAVYVTASASHHHSSLHHLITSTSSHLTLFVFCSRFVRHRPMLSRALSAFRFRSSLSDDCFVSLFWLRSFLCRSRFVFRFRPLTIAPPPPLHRIRYGCSFVVDLCVFEGRCNAAVLLLRVVYLLSQFIDVSTQQLFVSRSRQTRAQAKCDERQ